MSPLPSGQSEVDTVTLRLPDYGKEITNWKSYRYTQRFLTPCASWEFVVSDEDTTLTQQLLVPGARVELAINQNVQCSGFIDKKRISTSAQGTTVTIQGRDLLGPVVDATVDPAFKFSPGMTVPQMVLAVLAPFGITKVYNSDLFNIYVQSGYRVGSKGGTSAAIQAPVRQATVQSDGTIAVSYNYVQATSVTNPVRPDLRTLTYDQLKPHAGEGCYAFIERFLRRLGLTMWAMADGSGVVIDEADFSTPPQNTIIHKRSDPSTNTVLQGEITVDQTEQPSAIVAFGKGGGQNYAASKLVIIMVNELTGLDEQGNPLPEIANIKARYKSAKVLPIRSELVPLQRPLGDQKIAKPLFLKDNDSGTLAQLEAFTRREMANHQQKALQLQYELLGHTFNGKPWTVNSQVTVDDEVLGVSETMWVWERTFVKSVGGGTETHLVLIRPNTINLSQ